jgi:uncharacterized protein with FMN-binding domain
MNETSKQRASNKQQSNDVRKKSPQTAAIVLAGLVMGSTLLAGCGGSDAVPADNDFQGTAGDSTSSSTDSSSDDSSSSSDSSGASKDTGAYKDGSYEVDGQTDSSGDDTIDVKVTVANGDVTDVTVTGHPTSDLSVKHQNAFIQAIPGVVVGKPLKGLKVDKVAGASWTSEAFNTALNSIREDASVSQ